MVLYACLLLPQREQQRTRLQKAYEEEVAASFMLSQIGDIHTDQLSGPEAMVDVGKLDGQIMMIRRGNKVEAHQWTAAEGHWVKIRDLPGGESGEGASEGKKTYRGKEYDYVFDMELGEGTPPLKVPFNNGDDPRMAAYNFLQDSDMPPVFLDLVAKFITEKTKHVAIGPQEVQYKDPLSEVKPHAKTPAVQYYPKTDFVHFDQANIQAILGTSCVSLTQRWRRLIISDENVLESFEHYDSWRGTFCSPTGQFVESSTVAS